MKDLKDFNDKFRIFEVVQKTRVFQGKGHKTLEKGYRFIGFYFAENGVWISNTDITIGREYVKELYIISFEEVKGE